MKRMTKKEADKAMLDAADAILELVSAGEHSRIRWLNQFIDNTIRAVSTADEILKITETNNETE